MVSKYEELVLETSYQDSKMVVRPPRSLFDSHLEEKARCLNIMVENVVDQCVIILSNVELIEF